MRFLLALFVLVSCGLFAQETTEPQWLPPLASGEAPSCPDHSGLRQSRSAVAVASQAQQSAYITGSANSVNGGSCEQVATLVLLHLGTRRSIDLQHVTRSAQDLKRDPLEAPDPTRSYSVIDFSPDGHSILLEREGTDDWHNMTFRDVDIAVLDTTGSGQPRWANTWDLMHWNGCNATVEAQGFSASGSLVLRVRPSTSQSKPRSDCVTSPELWSVDLDRGSATRLPDKTLLHRNGKTSGVDWITCKNDPDVVAACFSVRGRLSFYNGGPSTRIWRVGTHRMLGVPSEIIRENVSDALGPKPFDTEVYGDFKVCPFTKEKSGAMQMVCIESASGLTAEPR